MKSQRVGHDWATELNWTNLHLFVYMCVHVVFWKKILTVNMYYNLCYRYPFLCICFQVFVTMSNAIVNKNIHWSFQCYAGTPVPSWMHNICLISIESILNEGIAELEDRHLYLDIDIDK